IVYKRTGISTQLMQYRTRIHPAADIESCDTSYPPTPEAALKDMAAERSYVQGSDGPLAGTDGPYIFVRRTSLMWIPPKVSISSSPASVILGTWIFRIADWQG